MTIYSHPLYAGAPISQRFGANPNNGNNGPGGHNGHDYAVDAGTPVRAVADGIVEFEGWASGDYRNNAHWFVAGAGIYVAIDHGHGAPDSTYSHLSRTVVNKGQRVKRGQIIGYVGTTGNSTGPHLHFSMFPPGYKLDTPTYGTVNPDVYLNAKPKQCIVDKGDSMASIAAQYKVSLKALIAANPHVANPNIIHAGMVLNLPA